MVIIKRDGIKKEFNADKIFKALTKAFKACVYTCGEASPWAFFFFFDNTIIAKNIQRDDYAEESLADLVKRLIKDKVADNFKLINFTIDLDNYNPDKLSSDTKKLMNKKNIWSL